MYSIIILWCVVVLDEVRVVSWNLHPLDPDFDVEPVEVPLLQLVPDVEVRTFNDRSFIILLCWARETLSCCPTKQYGEDYDHLAHEQTTLSSTGHQAL